MNENVRKFGVTGGRWLSVWLMGLVLLNWSPLTKAEPVCAQVKIEIKQELILERQAFDAMMKINNNLDTVAIDNVQVNVHFEDDAGNGVVATSDPNDTSAKFFIRIDSMTGISDVSGTGRVEPNTTGEIHWLIIPTTSASDTPSGTLYFVGATLSYTLGGQPESVEVTPDFITVKPLPQLTLDYFLTKQVIGDDPFTTQIEPSEPYTLGVRVKNNGIATAPSVRIDSAQPEIKENPQGLLIDFSITGSSVDDLPSEPVLLINFGDIEASSAKMGRWDMITSLAGEFISFSATLSHADELGGAATSILEQPVTHFLVRDVLVDLPGRDGVRDFLALDGQTLRVYESDDTADVVVSDQSAGASLGAGSSSGPDQLHTLTLSPAAGFNYVQLTDPYNGNYVVKEVIRSDGKRIPLHNAWASKVRDRSTNPPTWTYYVNLFDANATDSYTVRMGPSVIGPVPPVVQVIADRTTSEGIQVGFLVEASDPNGDAVALSAKPLPVGAAFIDNGDGTATFNWTPAEGQAGTYTITFTASDGFLSASRSPTIKVNPAWDTDGDGMDDAWEMANFGTLDRDGTGDFDGDGVSDLDEFLNGTDPTSAQVSVAPVITPPGGSYADYVDITLSTPTPNTTIYYTLDGSTPTAASFRYAGPITVAQDVTLQAITIGNGYSDSTVSTESYLITRGGPFQQDDSPQQLLVVEAEHYSASQTAGGQNWSPDYTLDYTGDSAMAAQPDSGNRVASGDSANSPSLEYQVNFLTTGTHYIWVRGLAVDGNGDTIHIGLDGTAFSSSDRLQLADNVLNTWGWTRTTEDGPVASFEVPSTGEHTLQLWMDKDGAVVDKILITTDPDYVPSNAGPAESLTNSGNGVPVLHALADQTAVHDSTVNLAVVASDPNSDTLIYSASGLPTGLSIDSQSGSVSGLVDSAAAAENTVQISVADGPDVVTTAFVWNIVAQDQIVPTVTAPADVVSEATGVTMSVVLGGPAMAVDDIDGNLVVSNDAPAVFPLGVTYVIYSATDSAGNTGSATQKVIVQDTTPPSLVVPADITVISGVSVGVDVGTATANDLFQPVTITNDAPTLFPVGNTIVTWMATDTNGNAVTAQQQITVTETPPPPDADGDGVPDANDLCPGTPTGEPVDADGCSAGQLEPDLVAPVVTPPAAVTVEAVAVTTPVTLGTASAVDESDGFLAVSSDAPAEFPLGVTVVTYSATDSSGNVGTATQTVTVVDTTLPVLTVPADVVAEVSGTDPVSIVTGDATATDLFGPVVITNDAPALFAIGTTVVTWTATDANGNANTGQQQVMVTFAATDSDSDGVLDENDLCANTGAGEVVDVDGCSADQVDAERVGAMMKLSTNVSIPTYEEQGIQELLFDTVVYNNGMFTDALYPGKIVIPPDFAHTHVDIQVSVDWAFSNSGDARHLTMAIERDGVLFSPDGRASDKRSATKGNNMVQQAFSASIPVEPGDIITIQVIQSSGAPLDVRANVNTWLKIDALSYHGVQ